MEDTISQGWRKSSYSGNGGGNCVEVGHDAGRVAVRDTKDRDGGTLSVPADAWREFAEELKRPLALAQQSARSSSIGMPGARFPGCYSSLSSPRSRSRYTAPPCSSSIQPRPSRR